MNLKINQVSNLRKIVETISRFGGVVGILLFGSMARGDYDEYSDYDLLVVFEDKSAMWREWDELFKAVGSFGLNTHVIPISLEEFKEVNPVFLEELSKNGRVLFARLPMEASLKPIPLKPFSLIVYSMAGLNYKDKMKISYFLYRKGGEGFVTKAGGAKLNEGCILVPKDAAKEIVGFLSEFGIKARKLEVELREESLRRF